MPVVDAGDVIAPLNAVLERLEGKITLADAEALITAFSSERIRQVQPGDLITARAFNQVLVDYEDLRRRVEALEGSTAAPVLVSYAPAGTVPIGTVITLIGSGFDPGDPAWVVAVNFGGETISQFLLGSGPGRLAFLVPTTFTGLPRTVSARVSVGNRFSAALPVVIGPPPTVPQGGEVHVMLDSSSVSPPGNIAVSSRLTYIYTVDSRTVRPADYTFDLAFSELNGAAEAAWRSSLAITPASARIGIGSPQDVTVALTVPPGATSGRVQFVALTTDTVTMRDPSPIAITVGAPPDVPDPRAQFGFDSTAQSFNLVRDIVFNGQTMKGIEVPRNTRTAIVLLLEAVNRPEGSGAGFYDIDPGTLPAGWAVTVSPRSNVSMAEGGPGIQTTVRITADPTDGVDTRLLRITANHKPSQTAASDFKTYHEFPVQVI